MLRPRGRPPLRAYAPGDHRTHWSSNVRERRLTPRVKQAVRLYASAQVPTKAAAAEAVGLSKAYFYMMTSPAAGNGQLNKLHETVDQMVNDRTIDTAALIRKLAGEAVRETGRLMVHAQSESVKLGAAKELMDRNPETAKHSKLQIDEPKLDRADAQLLAEALVASAEARSRHREAAIGNYVRVDTDKPFDPSVLPALPGAKLSEADLGLVAEVVQEDEHPLR